MELSGARFGNPVVNAGRPMSHTILSPQNL